MIHRILLIAAREFRQIAATRSFWLTLLLLPAAFAIGPIASRFLDKNTTERVMLIDRSGGGTAAAIARRLELDHQRRVLTQLSRYVERHKLERADRSAAWASHDRWYADAEVDRFARAGGARAAIARLDAVRAGDTPAFEPPAPAYTVLPVPAAIAATPDARLDTALEPMLRPAKGAKDKPLDYAVLIPADFGRSPVVRLWANGPPADFIAPLQDTVGRELRARFLQASGVSADTAAAAATIAPAIAVARPPAGGGGRERMVIRSILPLAATYLLLMSLLLSGSWMLQGSVEERSNKLIESMLACVSPDELMYGKLAGTAAVGLSMILTWVVCGVLAAYTTHGAIADFIRPALDSVTSLGAIATIAYFFVAGYIMVAMIFLVVGTMSESMRDAQGYLTPIIMIIMIPIFILMQAVLRGSGGVLVEALTWIPIYTPFAVLARLGTGLPAWQIWATGVTLALFIALELVMLGRIFRASLLASGERVGLKHLLARLRRTA